MMGYAPGAQPGGISFVYCFKPDALPSRTSDVSLLRDMIVYDWTQMIKCVYYGGMTVQSLPYI